jgi:hypothetical protein
LSAEDEYDVQDLFHALLRIFFVDGNFQAVRCLGDFYQAILRTLSFKRGCGTRSAPQPLILQSPLRAGFAGLVSKTVRIVDQGKFPKIGGFLLGKKL